MRLSTKGQSEYHSVHKLKNGVTLLMYPSKDCLTAAFGVFVRTGAMAESVKNHEQGIAHVIEHMMFKSSEKHTTDQINNKFSDLGADNNAYTDFDSTVYHARVPYQNILPLIDLMTEMVRFPLFVDSELKTEKGAIISEIRRREDHHDWCTISDARSQFFKPGHRLVNDVIGLEEDVTKLTGKDLLTWHYDHYTAGNIVLVVVGRFCEEEVERHIRDLWEDMDKKPRVKLGFTTSRYGTRTIERATQQVQLAQMSSRIIKPKTHEAYTHDVMMTLYGGGMTSRLFRELREKRGLCYACNGWSSWFGQNGNMFSYTYVGTDLKNYQLALDLIGKVQDGLINKPVGKTELERVKNLMIGLLMTEHDSLISHLRSAGERYLVSGESTDIYRDIEMIYSIDADSIQEDAIKTFADAEISETICLPKTDK